MCFWWFMLLCDLIIPIVMVIAGRMMWNHCPKHINSMLGYRTTRSMKNMDTWKFAHNYCGKLWWKIGWVMVIPSALIHIPLYHSDKNTIGFAGIILVTIQCFIMIFWFIQQRKLWKNILMMTEHVDKFSVWWIDDIQKIISEQITGRWSYNKTACCFFVFI